MNARVNQLISRGDGGRRGPGFTLIEIVLVISIMVLILSALIPLMSIPSEERELKKAADTLEKYARTARTAALYEQAYSAIEISPGGFLLKIEPGEKKDKSPEEESLFFAEKPAESSGEESYSHKLAKGASIQIKAWTEKKWRDPEGYLWRFQPSGICEPMQFRIAMEDSWIELGFSPLTAEVEEESYAFQ